MALCGSAKPVCHTRLSSLVLLRLHLCILFLSQSCSLVFPLLSTRLCSFHVCLLLLSIPKQYFLFRFTVSSSLTSTDSFSLVSSLLSSFRRICHFLFTLAVFFCLVFLPHFYIFLYLALFLQSSHFPKSAVGFAFFYQLGFNLAHPTILHFATVTSSSCTTGLPRGPTRYLLDKVRCTTEHLSELVIYAV